MPLYYDALLQVLLLDLDKSNDYFHLVGSNALFPTLKYVDSLFIKILFLFNTLNFSHHSNVSIWTSL